MIRRPYVVALFVLLAFFCQLVFGGLPPTRTKGSNDASSVVTFDLQLPFFNLLHTGTKASVYQVTTPTFAQVATPSTPIAGTDTLYFKADGNLYQLDSAGVETVYLPATAVTTGSVPFIGAGPKLLEDNAKFFWDNTNKRLYVGINPTASPGDTAQLNIENAGGVDSNLNLINRGANNALAVQTENANAGDFTNSNNAGFGATLTIARSRGTITAKTQMLAGDFFGGTFFQGYTGATFTGYGAAIAAVATENITATNSGAELVFTTSPNGTNAGNIPRLIIDQDGTTEPGLDATYTLGKVGSRWTNLFLSGFEDFTEIATPATPAANHDRCYVKNDGAFYCKNSAGTESLIGPNSGSSGTGSTILVQSTNGFGGSTVTAGSTVTIKVNTTINANVLKGDGNSILAAVAGTDYQAPGAYITAIAGDMVATGPGVANGVIQTNTVTNSKLNTMAASTFKGNSTTGVANPTDLTAASVVTILQTPLNALYCALTGCSMTGAISMGSNFIRAVTDPVLAQDAATKAYVDSQLAQLNPAERVQAASLANVAGTYTNVVPGVCIADTFTTTATTAFALDGYSGALNDRFLFKNQTSSFQDGVWVLTTQAVGGVSGAILTRALDFDNSADMNSGQIIPIINGTQAGSSYFQTANVTTCSSDAQTWTQFTKASSAYLQVANNFSDVANSTLAFNAVAPQSAVKGDLIVFNGTNWVRVGAGSNGSVLAVDSTTSQGVSWGSTSTIAIAASDIDWSLATPFKNLYTKTLTGNTAFTFSNLYPGKNIIVRVTNTPSNYTVSWPTNAGWSGSTVPVQTTGSHTDVYTFIYDGGSSVFGSAVQNF